MYQVSESNTIRMPGSLRMYLKSLGAATGNTSAMLVARSMQQLTTHSKGFQMLVSIFAMVCILASVPSIVGKRRQAQ